MPFAKEIEQSRLSRSLSFPSRNHVFLLGVWCAYIFAFPLHRRFLRGTWCAQVLALPLRRRLYGGLDFQAISVSFCHPHSMLQSCEHKRQSPCFPDSDIEPRGIETLPFFMSEWIRRNPASSPQLFDRSTLCLYYPVHLGTPPRVVPHTQTFGPLFTLSHARTSIHSPCGEICTQALLVFKSFYKLFVIAFHQVPTLITNSAFRLKRWVCFKLKDTFAQKCSRLARSIFCAFYDNSS